MKNLTLNHGILACLIAMTATAAWADQTDNDVTETTAQQSFAQRQESLKDMREKLDQFELTKNQDLDFAALMQLYADALTKIAATEQKYGADPKMKALARQELSVLTKKEAQLQHWQERFHKYD